MGQFVNPSNSAFQASLNSEIYIDKTALIAYTNKVLGSTQAFICNSRPRRFGKSIAANMLAAYYSKGCDSKEMFGHLKISGYDSFETYLNKYDVLHFDVQWFMTSLKGPGSIVQRIEACLIREMLEIYPEFIVPYEFTLAELLSRIHTKTNKQFVIIIDEWDVLIRDASANQALKDEYIEFLRSLFKGIEPTKYIALAYLTGILPIIKTQTQSALNNFEEFTMLDSSVLSEFFGFTDKEVFSLCQKYGRDFSDVKRWYDGYNLAQYDIYNPKAVVSLMLRGTFMSYWSQTGTYESIQPFINMNYDGLKTAIIEMLSGVSVQVETSSFKNDLVRIASKDDILTLLIHLGYLGYDQKKSRAFIPNEEIRLEFERAITHQKWSEMILFQQSSERLLEAVLDHEEDFVADEMENIHNTFASSIQYNNENSLCSVLTIGFLSTMKYYFKPVREMPTGRGFADFVYIPKPEFLDEYPALVVELKWKKTAETALDQIKQKKYTDSLKQYTGSILMVGINYDKKTKKHECVIEEV